MFDEEFSRFAEMEYYEAKKELERLEDLWDDAKWYHSEVSTFKNWKAPWYTSFPGSSVEMYSQDHTSEDPYDFYYIGTVENAPELPPMIVYSEIQLARALYDTKREQLQATHDWAPGGAKYAVHLESEGAKAYAFLSDKFKKEDGIRQGRGEATRGDGHGHQERSGLGEASETN